jgi:hypothetical protein
LVCQAQYDSLKRTFLDLKYFSTILSEVFIGTTNYKEIVNFCFSAKIDFFTQVVKLCSTFSCNHLHTTCQDIQICESSAWGIHPPGCQEIIPTTPGMLSIKI